MNKDTIPDGPDVGTAPASAVQITEHFGGRLAELRRERGWGVRELARRIGVSPGTVQNWELSATPMGRVDLLLRLQWAFRLGSIEQLFGEFSTDFPSLEAAGREAHLADLEGRASQKKGGASDGTQSMQAAPRLTPSTTGV